MNGQVPKRAHKLTPRLPVFTDGYFLSVNFGKVGINQIKVTHRGELLLEAHRPELKEFNPTLAWRWIVDESFFDIPAEYKRFDLELNEPDTDFYVTTGFITDVINYLGLNGYESSDLELTVTSPVGYSSLLKVDRKLFYHIEYHEDTMDCIEMSDSRELETARDVNEVMGYRDMTSKRNRDERKRHREGRRKYIKSLSEETED